MGLDGLTRMLKDAFPLVSDDSKVNNSCFKQLVGVVKDRPSVQLHVPLA